MESINFFLEDGIPLDRISRGEICPYCGKVPEFVDSIEVYGKSYGWIYLCKPCDAWVGVHKNTDVPLGRLANGVLREYKKQAHAAFDVIWQHMISPSVPKNVARGKAYQWLAEHMQLPMARCHIGMFDENQCIQVIKICSQFKFEGDG